MTKMSNNTVFATSSFRFLAQTAGGVSQNGYIGEDPKCNLEDNAGDAGPPSWGDRENKRYTTEDSEAQRRTRRDFNTDCKAAFKAKPNNMATMRHLFPHHTDSCIMRDSCENKRHWLVRCNSFPQPTEAKAEAWKARSDAKRHSKGL